MLIPAHNYACPSQTTQPVASGMDCFGVRKRYRERSAYALDIGSAKPGLYLSEFYRKCFCLRECNQRSRHAQRFAWTITIRNYKLNAISAFCA